MVTLVEVHLILLFDLFLRFNRLRRSLGTSPASLSRRLERFIGLLNEFRI